MIVLDLDLQLGLCKLISSNSHTKSLIIFRLHLQILSEICQVWMTWLFFVLLNLFLIVLKISGSQCLCLHAREESLLKGIGQGVLLGRRDVRNVCVTMDFTFSS